MEEIVKHINDTNASYRQPNAGDAKNTDLFLDNEHYSLFKDSGEKVTVRYNKENLTKAILFISSILPRKFDQSATHELVRFSKEFVLDQLAIIDALFTEEGKSVNTFTQVWNARKDIQQKNGKIDKRFYFNGLLKDVLYTDSKGIQRMTKFTIRNYFAGGYSDLHIIKSEDGIFDIRISNAIVPTYDHKEDDLEDIVEIVQKKRIISFQQIYYGAPGTGKSHTINVETEGESVIRTTFHPDSDYSTFVGAYKPTMDLLPICNEIGQEMKLGNTVLHKEQIVYKFVSQAFLQAYVQAWKYYAEDAEKVKKQFLVIEEINRGNCAQIFGDLFQLLDRNDAGFSDYPIKADEDMKKYLYKELHGLEIKNTEGINALYKGRNVVSEVINGDILLLPNNLYIWATMNTSDQSLFPIDSAFKRRWDWQYVPISKGYDEKGLEIKWAIEAGTKRYDWWSFLEKINHEIDDTTHSEDKKLGFFFCMAEDNIVSVEKFVSKVIFYLWNDVFKNYGFDKPFFKKEDGNTLAFSDFYESDESGNTSVRADIVKMFLEKLGVNESTFIATPSDDTLPKVDEDGNNASNPSKDFSRYSINGKGSYSKGGVVYEALKLYISNNPNKNSEEIVKDWLSLGVNVPNFIETKDMHDERAKLSSDDRIAEKSKIATLTNGQIVHISNQFNVKRISDFITRINNKDWNIHIQKI